MPPKTSSLTAPFCLAAARCFTIVCLRPGADMPLSSDRSRRQALRWPPSSVNAARSRFDPESLPTRVLRRSDSYPTDGAYAGC